MLKRIKEKLPRLIIYLMILVVVILILTPVLQHYRKVTEARTILSEAKNVQLTMRLLSIQYNANGQSIYDPAADGGMSEATAKEVADMSGAEGEIILLSWNHTYEKPERFLYRSGDYMVIYQYELDRDQDTWEVNELNRILDPGK